LSARAKASSGSENSMDVATVNGKDIRGLDYQRRYQNQMMAYQAGAKLPVIANGCGSPASTPRANLCE